MRDLNSFPLCFRAERESLEKALFESQELSASLEAEVTRLEGRRNSLILANEALTRELPPSLKDPTIFCAKPLGHEAFPAAH